MYIKSFLMKSKQKAKLKGTKKSDKAFNTSKSTNQKPVEFTKHKEGNINWDSVLQTEVDRKEKLRKHRIESICGEYEEAKRTNKSFNL